jgi:hypothetical protein
VSDAAVHDQLVEVITVHREQHVDVGERAGGCADDGRAHAEAGMADGLTGHCPQSSLGNGIHESACRYPGGQHSNLE